ncbi:Os05g0310900 [Oryza sativa Japonica Group]|uniref:Os05g0310900 protein n=1 Tax=Oryza sativa subsp. japonica TaxID=39947 RepID=A0A0P0WKI7_ORYSJ|nr:hypothetical protein EE612_028540 [Oryza sativa]BAS93285.1 Os05g0310900 [Oryza sativa Japonica Group]
MGKNVDGSAGGTTNSMEPLQIRGKRYNITDKFTKEEFETLLPFSINLSNTWSLPESRQWYRDDNIVQVKHLSSFILNVDIGFTSRY